MMGTDEGPDPQRELAEIERAAEREGLPSDQREAVLFAARRVLAGGERELVDQLREQRIAAQAVEARITAALRQVARMVVVSDQPGAHNPGGEAAFARRAGVSRDTVRSWIGKGRTAKTEPSE